MNERSPVNDGAAAAADRIWTVPNALTTFRWVGSLGLLYFGCGQYPRHFVVWYLVLALTDWIDGWIAVRFHQRSVWGARLDSFADATLYAALLIGAVCLWGERLGDYWPWVSLACGSYAVATVYGLLKFGRWPSYHTWSAKGAWGFVLLAFASLVWNFPAGPLPLAMCVVTLANLESIAITRRLSVWQNDVPSVFRIPPRKQLLND